MYFGNDIQSFSIKNGEALFSFLKTVFIYILNANCFFYTHNVHKAINDSFIYK